jgi:hypothetical protein
MTMRRVLLIALLWIIGAALVAGIVIAVDLPPRTTPVTQSPSPTAAPVAAPSAAGPTLNSSSAASSSLPTASSPAPPAKTSIPRRPQGLRVHVPTLPAAQQIDPLAVAQTVIATLYSLDPAVDGGRTDAARRATYLLTPQLAASMAAPQTTGNGTQWLEWANSDAYVTVTSKKIAIAWTVADNRLRVVRNIGFIQTVHSKAGATALPQQTLAVTLVRETDGRAWRVERLETP